MPESLIKCWVFLGGKNVAGSVNREKLATFHRGWERHTAADVHKNIASPAEECWHLTSVSLLEFPLSPATCFPIPHCHTAITLGVSRPTWVWTVSCFTESFHVISHSHQLREMGHLGTRMPPLEMKKMKTKEIQKLANLVRKVFIKIQVVFYLTQVFLFNLTLPWRVHKTPLYF